MLFGFVTFFALGVLFAGVNSIFSAVIMVAISLLNLFSYVVGKMRPKDIFAIYCRLINVPIIVMLLVWGMLAAQDAYVWIFAVTIFAYLWLSGYWVRVWFRVVREISWLDVYGKLFMALALEERIMLSVLEASTEKRSFRRFVKRFGKVNVEKLLRLSKYDDQHLLKLRELIESRNYKQIMAMMATK